MIKVLGTKRVMILAVLLIINGVLAGALYMILTPQKLKTQRELNAVRGQVAGLQGDVERLQIEFEQLETQQAQFEELKADGFFTKQNRRDAEKRLEAIQKKAGVVSAIASVKPGKFIENAEAAKAEHKILSSPISIRVEAVDDIDVYKYLYLLENSFLGEVRLKELNLSRNSDVSATILRAISSGNNPPLVDAQIELTWQTMVPADEVIQDSEVTQGGGVP